MAEIIEFIADSGGSVVSRNVLAGVPLKWAFREASVDAVDNGWRFLSAADDDAYLADSANLTIVTFNEVANLEPAILPIYTLPVGTDLTIEREGGRIRLIDNATGAELAI